MGIGIVKTNEFGDFYYFYGDKPGLTKEEVEVQRDRAIQQMKDGTAPRSSEAPKSKQPVIDVRDLIKNLK